jgi:hypothetical protein
MRRRRLAALALVAAVAALHLWLADDLLDARLGTGAAKLPPRIEVAFVHLLAPTAPPPVPAPQRARPRPKAPAPMPAASAPPRMASAPEASASAAAAEASAHEPAASTTEPAASTPEPAASASGPAIAASEPAAAASAPPAFDWPPSTRLSYALTGNYRGPVEGQAQVEWLRSGLHYQVRMDVDVGPSFAPLVARRVVSDGRLTDRGLYPERFDQSTRVLFGAPRDVAITFNDAWVGLPDGRSFMRPPGVQDTASQFVQLTWLFTTRPELLAPGTSIEMPLALPRDVRTWTYDVLGHETLATRFGAIDTLHVKPRREARPGGDLVAELWIAPTLQYLPVRILIRQDAQTYVDLLISKLPLQAAPAPAAPVASGAASGIIAPSLQGDRP